MPFVWRERGQFILSKPSRGGRSTLRPQISVSFRVGIYRVVDGGKVYAGWTIRFLAHVRRRCRPQEQVLLLVRVVKPILPRKRNALNVRRPVDRDVWGLSQILLSVMVVNTNRVGGGLGQRKEAAAFSKEDLVRAAVWVAKKVDATSLRRVQKELDPREGSPWSVKWWNCGG